MSSIVVSGDTSGAITISAPAVSGTNTLTLPAVTDTLVGLAASQTLTNKTLSSAVLTGTLTAGASVGTNGQVLQSTGTGVQWGTVSGYSAPTIGSTSIASGATVTSIAGLTKITSVTHASLDENSYEQWDENLFDSIRTFDNMYFDNKNKVIDNIRFFIDNKAWYFEKGIPYSLGIGMYGPPDRKSTRLNSSHRT